MASFQRWSPHGLRALLNVLISGSGDFQLGTLQAMILGDTSTITSDPNWGNTPTLDAPAGGVLGEYTTAAGATVYREDVQNITTAAVPNEAKIDCDTVEFGAIPGGGSNNPTHVLFYVKLTGAAADTALTSRVPLLIVDAVFAPDGSDFEVVIPIDALGFLDTAV